jgi:Uma2 family endonuclease
VVQSHAMLDLELLAPEKPRRLKRVEYDELVRLGTFEDEHVELLHGVLVAMSPTYPEHAGPITRLTALLVPVLVGRADIRVQLSYWADDESVPEPDFAVVPHGPWQREHPSSAHIVIEVANSSLRKDRLVKAPLYAASRVEEYWIVNTRERCIHVFRDSDGTTYRSESRHDIGGALALTSFPDVTIAVADVFA